MGGPAYFSVWGPTDGPIRSRDAIMASGVVEDPEAPPIPIGIAFPVGYVPDERGGATIAPFRLSVHKPDVPGLWTCQARRFMRFEAGC